MKRIRTRAELEELARELGVRPDWHEPDQQDVSVRMHGTEFDNALPAATWLLGSGEPRAEYYVVIHQVDPNGIAQAAAAVNLAMLFAWACGYQDN